MKIGLYIGRFQPFHNGHKLVIDTMRKEVDIIVIGIGLSEEKTKNPFDYHTRHHFITHTFSHIEHLHIFPLSDSESDREWVKQILKIPIITDSEDIIVYAGDLLRDTAVKVIQEYQDIFLPRTLQFREVPRSIIPISATKIRNDIKNT